MSDERGLLIRLVVGFAMLIAGFSPSARAALYECGPFGPNDSNYTVGWADTHFSGAVTRVGASAQIEARYPDLCVKLPIGETNPANDATAWVMIAASPFYEGYVQSGFIRLPSQPMKLFIEQEKQATSTSCPDLCTYILETIGNGSRYTHSELFCSACHNGQAAIQTYIGGVLRNTTPWNPVVVWGPQNEWTPQWFGETLRPGSDIPGDLNLRSWFRNMYTQDLAGGYHSPEGPFVGPDLPHGRGAMSTINVNEFSILCTSACDPA